MNEAYVIKSSSGSYFHHLRKDASYDWTCCQRCARHMSRGEAHRLAHAGGRSYKVVKIVKLVKKKPA
jgi:hypothetical protein